MTPEEATGFRAAVRAQVMSAMRRHDGSVEAARLVEETQRLAPDLDTAVIRSAMWSLLAEGTLEFTATQRIRRGSHDTH